MTTKQLSIFDIMGATEPMLGTWFEEYPGAPVPWDEIYNNGVGKVFLVDVSTESHIWLKAVRILRTIYNDQGTPLGLPPHWVRSVVWNDGGKQNGFYTGDYWPDEANHKFYKWEDMLSCQ